MICYRQTDRQTDRQTEKPNRPTYLPKDFSASNKKQVWLKVTPAPNDMYHIIHLGGTLKCTNFERSRSKVKVTRGQYMSKMRNIPAAITQSILVRLTPNQFYFVAFALGYKKCPGTFWGNIQYFWLKFEVEIF